MLNNSVGEFGTLRITNFLPSVEPMPIDANDRTEVTSVNIWLGYSRAFSPFKQELVLKSLAPNECGCRNCG